MHIEPYWDESLVGFVFRMAARRGLGTGYKLVALLDLSMNASPRRLLLERLSHELGLPQAAVDRMATWHEIQDADGVRIPGARPQPSFLGNPCTFPIYDNLDLRYRRLCPRCLDEAPYYRARWNLTCVSACPAHGLELLAKCPGCGARLAWRGTDVAICGTCGRSMAREPGTPVTPMSRDGASVTLGLLGDPSFMEAADDARSIPPLRGLEPGIALEFLAGLGREFKRITPPRITTPDAIALGVQACRDWPHNFRTLPHARNHERARRKVLVWDWLKLVGRKVAKLPDTEGVTTVKSEIVALRSEIQGNPGRRRRNLL